MTNVPTAADVLALGATACFTITTDHLDNNKHMNVRHFFDAAANALTEVCAVNGIDPRYITGRGLTVFTAEQHLRYFSELRLGDSASTHVQFLARSPKALHAIVYILNTSRNLVAATFEAVLVHVDMATRHAVEFPDDIAQNLDRAASAAQVTWSAPVCGAMGVGAGRSHL